MRRALDLATLGAGRVSPNPLVGCVVVMSDRVIGEGWHRAYGEAHAEVNAINAVADRSALRESTVYVNLEPCAHFGKTPPCADMLTEVGVKKVVVCNIDANPLVGGKGIQKLRAHGIETVTGVLEDEGLHLNRRFFTFIKKKRPYFILKWAETRDGFIAREDGSSKWISSEVSRQLVHKWRTEEDAILVGTRTALYDNPRLNVRDWTGRDPIRIVIDKTLKIDQRHHLFNRQQKTLCYNTSRSDAVDQIDWIRIGENDLLGEMARDLYGRGVQSVIVEGGAATLKAFIDANLWDEARVFTNEQVFHRGIPAPRLDGTVIESKRLSSDTLSLIIPATDG